MSGQSSTVGDAMYIKHYHVNQGMASTFVVPQDTFCLSLLTRCHVAINRRIPLGLLFLPLSSTLLTPKSSHPFTLLLSLIVLSSTPVTTPNLALDLCIPTGRKQLPPRAV